LHKTKITNKDKITNQTFRNIFMQKWRNKQGLPPTQ